MEDGEAQLFFEEIQPLLARNRPRLVFDFSNVRQLNACGVEMLLTCFEEVMKHNGDLKLAAVQPEHAVILEMTRVDGFFEIFENSTSAADSFYFTTEDTHSTDDPAGVV
jgi:anti-anti-sigma factor